MCTVQQTCKLDVLTLTTIISDGFAGIQSTSAAQIKVHLLSTCGHLPMLNLAVLRHATPQQPVLC